MKETTRIEAFSDGVFAIAITLLILDIHVPDTEPNTSLIKAMLAEWPSILALLIGFFTILICWINHHYMFQIINKSNSKLLLINGFKLLVVTITPFSTALLSKHLIGEWCQSAINIYTFNFALMGIAMTSVWCYAYLNGFVKVESNEILRAVTQLYIFASISSITIWIVSFFSIAACMILSALMFLIFIFPEKIVQWRVGKMKRNISEIVT
jgi:uncharacterized membrane protein